MPRQRLRPWALCVATALAAHGPSWGQLHAAAKPGASVVLGVSATVLPRTRVEVRAPKTFTIASSDLERGYVVTEEPLLLVVTTNLRHGVDVLVGITQDYLLFGHIAGLAHTVQFGEQPQTIRLPVQQAGARVEYRLRFKLHLSEHAVPGTYPWPVTIQGHDAGTFLP